MVPGAHLGADPEFFAAWTLYNITPTNDSSKKNLEVLLNVINNRGQPLLASVEYFENQNIDDGLFGNQLTGQHHVWCLKWIADRKGVMTEESLANESHKKLMLTNLGESIALSGEIITSGPETNTFYIRYDSF